MTSHTTRASSDPWRIPSTSAGSGDRGGVVDEEAARAAEAARERNFLLSRLLIGIAALLSLAFAVVVGSGAYAHSIDRDLFNTWWAHHAEYDCCTASEAKCQPGVDALVELRGRLRAREGGARDVVTGAVARAVGLADLDVSDAPADAAAVDRIFATCPALSAQRTALSDAR